MTTRSWDRVRAIAGPALVAATGVALAARTWKVWGDPVVDFGREIYLAWRLADGAVLYRDVAHFGGPLPPVVNGVWFTVMGPGLLQLIALNLLVLTAVTAALFSICRSLGGFLAGTVAAIVFLCLQGLGYFGAGTYNFVTPYSHEVTYGILFGLTAVAAVRGYARTGRPRWAFAAGASAGLSFLTKPETFLATSCAAMVGLAAAKYRGPASHGEAARGSPRSAAPVAAALAGAAIPPLAAFAGLAVDLGASGAADGLLRQWRMVFDGRITSLPYYRWVVGLDTVAANVLSVGVWTLGGIAVVLTLAWVARHVRDERRGAIVAFGAVVVTVLGTGAWAPWHRVWFVLPAAAVAVLIDSARRLERGEGRGVQEITALAFATLASVLLVKQALHPRIFHYGFALSVPAVAVCVLALVAWIPARLRSGGVVFRGAALGLVAGIALFHLALSHAAIEAASASSAPIGVGRDVLRADSRRAVVLQGVIARIQEGPAEATVAVLPEGAYVNFVLRRPNPTAFVQLMPPELITWGENAVLDAYRGSAPDFVVLVHRDLSEYGKGPFGGGYGDRLMEWIRDNYRTVQVLGGEPFGEDTVFGAEVLERKSRGTTPEHLASLE